MTEPEEALGRAREEAARGRAEGRYPADRPDSPLEDTFVDDVPDLDTLAEWARIDVEPDVLYSTRRLGGPVTAVKRLLLRLLRQYHVEVESRQTRFNIALLARLRLVEERLDALERRSTE
jgi:hypothetical protein